MTRKAVILARGLGTRMQRETAGVALDAERAQIAARGMKALIPLNERPFLDYIVDSLIRAGLRDLCFVIAPDGDAMRQHAARIGRSAGVAVHCAVQQEPRGTADAVLAAEQFAGEDSFVMCNGDNLYPDDALARLAELQDDRCRVVAFDREALVTQGNIGADRVASFAAVTASDDGSLLRIVEKPSDPDQYARDGRLWVSMNLFRFTPAAFDACRAVKPDPKRGELEVTTAVADMVAADSSAFGVVFCEGGVFDLTSRGDIASAEAALKNRRLCF